MFSQIDNPYFKGSELFTNERYAKGRYTYTDNTISNINIFPITLVNDNITQGLTINKVNDWFSIGIINSNNHKEYITIDPLKGTSNNNINYDYNKYRHPHPDERKQEMMFDLKRGTIGDSISLDIRDDILYLLINNIEYKLWTVSKDTNWKLMVYMSDSSITIL